MYLRGRGPAFLADLVGRSGTPHAAVVGATYLWGGAEVNLCLFGSRQNLDGAVPCVDPTRRQGWFSSHTVGVRQLLTFTSFGGDDWDENAAYAASSGVDDEDLVWSAANITRGQGLVGNASRPHSEAPSLRGHTILEGEFEWLARIYWWRADHPDFHNVAVGAPVFVRTVSGRPWSVYGPVPAHQRLAEVKLKRDRISPEKPRQLPAMSDGHGHVKRRPWWPFSAKG